MPNWTSDQQSAIESRNANLLVSAAAGSGKTAVLVERIIQLIVEDEIDIDRLLIVTFTNAAAGEMRERIMNALTKRVADGAENEGFLRRQIGLVHRANIMTVHAFCIDVVRNYFYEVDLDPAFRIGDTSELSLMLEAALDEVMEEAYESGSDAFLNLVESYGSNRSDDALMELLMKLYFFIQSQPEPLKWLGEQSDHYHEAQEIDTSLWLKGLMDMVIQDLEMAKDVIGEGVRLCEMPDGPKPYIETFGADLELVRVLEVASREGFDSLYQALKEVKFARLKSIKKAEKESLNPELIEEAKAIRDILKKKVVDPIKTMILRKDKARHSEEMLTLEPMMVSLYQIIKKFHEKYMEAKKEKNLLDFNDLEHFTISVLKNDEIAAAYKEKFKFIFLDEYQDSNIVQETIIGRIKRDNNLFLVGDVKQSIYRFRLADPTLFLNKYRTYKKSEDALSRRIDLAKNFRSRPEVLHGINYVFERLMSESFGEMAYDDDAKLYPGLTFEETEGNPLELMIIDAGADETLEDQGLIEMKKVELEAHAVAKRIRGLINTEIFDPKLGKKRPARLKDIVVLLRATRSWSQIFGDVFAEYGLPLYSDVGGGYFDALEIEVFLALLKLIDNSHQDLPLLTVLRSPIGGFTVDELIEIRLIDQSISFYDAFKLLADALIVESDEEALKNDALENEDFLDKTWKEEFTENSYMDETNIDLAHKAKRFLDNLSAWVKDERIWPLDEFLWKLMTESGFYHYVGAMPGGTSRQANLRLLIDKAGQFEKLGSGGLFEFISFFEKLKASNGDMGTASTIGESEDVVRLMSIHKSKGLEFPIVILAGAGKNFNLRDTYDKVLMHKNYGVGLRYTDPDKRYYSESLPQMIMKRQLKLESLAEEMRILYVALTRAVDKLIITGATGRFDSDIKRWLRGSSKYNLQSGRSYMDWIASIMSRHPDGSNIRELSDFPIFGDSDDGGARWTVRVLRKDELLKYGLNLESIPEESSQTKETSTTPKDSIDSKDDLESKIELWHKEINRKLSWSYPHKESLNMPFKLSVSDMKRASKSGMSGAHVRIPALIPKPKFMEGSRKKNGAEVGTLHHFVMQHLNIKGDLTPTGIQKQIAEMVLKNLLDSEDVQYIKVDKIAEFFVSELGKRMLNALHIHREIPFIINKKMEENEVMVQGIIDCYFEENDGLVILDYKTDFTGTKGTKAIAETYKVQVELYTEALTKLLDKPVKGAYLYFFDASESVKI